MTRPLIALVLLVLPTAALAAGGGVGQPEGWYVDLAFHAFNLVLFVGLIVYLARGVITEALKNRSAGIAKDIEESNRLRREAQDRCDAFDARLNRFEVEFDEMRAPSLAEFGGLWAEFSGLFAEFSSRLAELSRRLAEFS